MSTECNESDRYVILFQSHLSRIVTPGWVMVITGKVYTDSQVQTVIGMRTMDVNKCMYYYYLILLEKFGLSVRQWYLLFVFSRLL